MPNVEASVSLSLAPLAKNIRKLRHSVFDIQHSTFAFKRNPWSLVEDSLGFQGEPFSPTKLEKNQI